MPTQVEADSSLTQDILRSQLSYDPLTGEFKWIVPKKGARRNKVAGHIHKRTGYCIIHLFSQHWQAHRLAWLYMTGEWPADEIDHRDLNKSNNIWTNLREATIVQNAQNKRVLSSNSSGHPGVRATGKLITRWRALIQANKKSYHLGTFPTFEEAVEAYVSAKSRLHPFSPEVQWK